jgi:hypothetical protein
MLPTVSKQPADTLDFDVDFTRWIPDEDDITTAIAVVSPVDELVIDSVQISSPIVKVWTSAGVDGSTYTVTVTASTSGGRIKETEFKIRVRDT